MNGTPTNVPYRLSVFNKIKQVGAGYILSHFITCFLTISAAFIMHFQCNTFESIVESKGSQQEKLKELQRTFNEFKTNATPEVIINRWIKLFITCNYKMNGNPRYNNFDCASALRTFYNSFGANLSNDNVEALDNRVKKLYGIGQISFRKSYRTVEPGDFIIFNPISDGSWHCAVIFKKDNEYIQYLDVNILVDGMGVNAIRWSIKKGSTLPHKIKKIVSMSYSLWLGNLLKINT